MKMIENPTNENLMRTVLPCSLPICRVLMILWISAGAFVTAQENPAAAPTAAEGKTAPPMPRPPMRRPGGPGAPGIPSKPGDQRFPRTGNNLSPMQLEGIERLSEEDKKKLRAAIDQAWTLPALQQAKERYIRASEEFRATMRRSLQEVDPEMVKILEKIKPEPQDDPRQLPKLPPPSDSGFAAAAVDRLGVEMMAFVRPEQREKIRVVHGKVMQQPEVAAAVRTLLETAPEQRVEALRKLREVYRQAMAKELPGIPRPQQRATSADASGPPTTPVVTPELPKP